VNNGADLLKKREYKFRGMSCHESNYTCINALCLLLPSNVNSSCHYASFCCKAQHAYYQHGVVHILRHQQTTHPFLKRWWRQTTHFFFLDDVIFLYSIMRKAFFSQDHGGCESLSLTRMFPRLLRTNKYRTPPPRRRIIVVLLLLLLVVVVVVVFAKSLRSYYFQFFLWKRPKPVKVASYGDTISFSRWIFQTCIILNFRKSYKYKIGTSYSPITRTMATISSSRIRRRLRRRLLFAPLRYFSIFSGRLFGTVFETSSSRSFSRGRMLKFPITQGPGVMYKAHSKRPP